MDELPFQYNRVLKILVVSFLLLLASCTSYGGYYDSLDYSGTPPSEEVLREEWARWADFNRPLTPSVKFGAMPDSVSTSPIVIRALSENGIVSWSIKVNTVEVARLSGESLEHAVNLAEGLNNITVTAFLEVFPDSRYAFSHMGPVVSSTYVEYFVMLITEGPKVDTVNAYYDGETVTVQGSVTSGAASLCCVYVGETRADVITAGVFQLTYKPEDSPEVIDLEVYDMLWNGTKVTVPVQYPTTRWERRTKEGALVQIVTKEGFNPFSLDSGLFRYVFGWNGDYWQYYRDGSAVTVPQSENYETLLIKYSIIVLVGGTLVVLFLTLLLQQHNDTQKVVRKMHGLIQGALPNPEPRPLLSPPTEDEYVKLLAEFREINPLAGDQLVNYLERKK